MTAPPHINNHIREIVIGNREQPRDELACRSSCSDRSSQLGGRHCPSEYAYVCRGDVMLLGAASPRLAPELCAQQSSCEGESLLRLTQRRATVERCARRYNHPARRSDMANLRDGPRSAVRKARLAKIRSSTGQLKHKLLLLPASGSARWRGNAQSARPSHTHTAHASELPSRHPLVAYAQAGSRACCSTVQRPPAKRVPLPPASTETAGLDGAHGRLGCRGRGAVAYSVVQAARPA
jgi:hypothetical protein